MYHPVVLERDAVLGGLARTVDFGGNRMDIGGPRFFTKSAEVQALWDELLPTAGAPAYDDRVLGRPFRGVPGGEIVRGADVIRIEPCEERDAAGGAEHALVADVVLSSMPVKDLVAALPSAWFSDDVRKTAAALPYRDFMTAGLLVDRLLLKNETPHKTLGNIVPDCWIYIQEPDVRLGRLQVFNNWSPYLVRDPEHTVWLGLEYFCQEGDALWTMADDAFLRFATEELERIHVIAPGAVRESHVVRMQKAYPAYYGSYEAFPAVRAALDEEDYHEEKR